MVPSVAGELHREHLEVVTERAVAASGCSLSSVAAIAVTSGPGLAPCLHAGLDFAKSLAKQYKYVCTCIKTRLNLLYIKYILPPQQAPPSCPPHGSTRLDPTAASRVCLLYIIASHPCLSSEK